MNVESGCSSACLLQSVDKPNKYTVEMYARPWSSLVKCVQMSGKVTLFTPILMEMND